MNWAATQDHAIKPMEGQPISQSFKSVVPVAPRVVSAAALRRLHEAADTHAICRCNKGGSGVRDRLRAARHHMATMRGGALVQWFRRPSVALREEEMHSRRPTDLYANE